MSESTQRLEAAERKVAIVTAAMPLFARSGFKGVTTRQIAEAAGVSEALLYRHFPSKEALYEASQIVCLEKSAEDARRLEAMPDDTHTLVLSVYMMMRHTAGFSAQPQHDDIEAMLLRSLLSGDDFASGFLNAVSEPWVGKMRRAWEGAQAAGDLFPDVAPPDLTLWLSHHLASAVSFYSLHGKRVVPLPVDGPPLLDEIVRFALRGLGLTPQAIEQHFDPTALAALASQGEAESAD